MQTTFLASLIAASVAAAMAVPLAPQENTKLPPERLAQIAAAQID